MQGKSRLHSFLTPYLLNLQVVLDFQPWLHEPSLVELPWKPSEKVIKPLKIGVIWHDGVVQPHPPVTRCLEQTVRALEAAGHCVISWDVSLHKDLIECINKFYFLDGGKEFHDIIEAGKEPASPLMKWLLDSAPTKAYTVAETWKVSEMF